MERPLILKTFILTLLLVGCAPQSTPFVIDYQTPAPPRHVFSSRWFESIVFIEGPQTRGTGFVVGIDIDWVYIMTAQHILGLDDDITVDTRSADLYAVASEHDLAVIRLPNRRTYYRIYEFSQPILDSEVWAIGYSIWQGKHIKLIHRGRVVSLNFTDPNGNWTVTHNAGGRGGMSGGPLLNEQGKVVGICSFFADMGIGIFPNASELCAVPGSSAAIFWQKVQTEIQTETP